MTSEQTTLHTLQRRFGRAYVERRLLLQTRARRWTIGPVRLEPCFVHAPIFLRALTLALRVTGLYKLGMRNALSLSTRETSLVLPTLPPALDGLRVLHLSDLHIDGLTGFGQHLAHIVRDLDFDLCVLTGDVRFCDMGDYTRIMAELEALMPALSCDLGVYGIMGNHDYVEMIPLLESLDMHMLVNEAAPVRVNGAVLWLVGVDDPHYYKLHDFDKALTGVPRQDTRVLLAHSPEVIQQAGDLGFALYLSGHTHGGQICLPNGWAPYINARCPRFYTAGRWQYNDMVGYTSRGAGASGVFVRYFCPPEITLHHLKSSSENSKRL